MEPEGSLPYSQMPATCSCRPLFRVIRAKIWSHRAKGSFIKLYDQWHTEGGLGGSNPLTPKFRSFFKDEPNSQFRGNFIRNKLIRIWVSLICKLSGTPDYGDTTPRSPFSLHSVLDWICWTKLNPTKKISWVRHCLWQSHSEFFDFFYLHSVIFMSRTSFLKMVLQETCTVPEKPLLNFSGSQSAGGLPPV
jgi:hypothetical protein